MRRRAMISVVAGVILPLAAVGVAFACTPDANINGGNLGSAPPGGQISGWGTQFEPGAPVTVTWTEKGQVVFSGHADSNGAVPVSFRVPEGTPEGDNTVVAETRTSSGQRFVPKAYFRVVAPPQRSPDGGGKPDASPGTGSQPGTVETPASQPSAGPVSPRGGGGETERPAQSPGRPPSGGGVVHQGLTPVESSVPASRHQLPATRTALVSYAPDTALARVKIAPRATTASAAPLPVPAAGERPGQEVRWVVFLLAGAGLLLLAGGAGGLLAARRMPPSSPRYPDERSVSELEAELQEIIAEERLRETDPISRS